MLKSSARSHVFTTGLPPGVVAASCAAIDWIKNNKVECQQALEHAQYFTKKMDLPRAESAIVPMIIGENDAALARSQALYKRGFLVNAIRPPTVAKGTARLRFTFSRLHTIKQIDQLVEALRELI